MRKLLSNLRIAFSAVCGIACLLLIALWVRSYSYWDELYNPISNKHLIIIESASGRSIMDLTETSPSAPWIWHFSLPLHGRYWEGTLDDWEEANRDKGIGGFAAYANPWHTTYRAPLWLFLFLCAAIGAAPWLPWSTRFSVRTLLILMTVFAILIGLAVYAAKNVPVTHPPPTPLGGPSLSPYGLKRLP